MLQLNSNVLATWCEELTLWESFWCCKRLKAGGEGDGRGWDGWMASATQWTWVWVSSRSWWWIGEPGMLQSMESQNVRHNWVTEQTNLLVKWESAFLFTEPKKELHEHTNTHGSKWIEFTKEKEITKFSAQTMRGVKESPKARLTAVYILTGTNLYIFGWLLSLKYIIPYQSV